MIQYFRRGEKLMLVIKDIVKATRGKLLSGNGDIKPDNYEFDSRLVEQGTFFLPIKGENTDGHNYILECVKKGAIGFLIGKDLENKENIVEDSIDINKNIVIVEVDDTREAIFSMGRKNRENNLDIPIVAVTGSVGKTSTREMIASVLEEKYKILKTEKNYNNSLGIPYMLLKIDKQDVCVIEIGIDKIGEMQVTSGAVIPDVAVITNIGLSHIENFGNIEITYREKTKICENLKEGGICVVNGDDIRLSKIGNEDKEKIIKYGIQNDDEYTVHNIKNFKDKITFEIANKGKRENITINDIGNHNILNAMAAIKVGQVFGMNMQEIIQGISKYKNFDRRMKQEKIRNNCIVINDAYNASYDSIMSGLETIDKIPANKRIVVLGDILELGEYSKNVHTNIGKKIKEFNIDTVITYGKASDNIYNELKNVNINRYRVENKDEILNIIDKEIIDKTLIYIKSSNGMKLYELSDKIIERYK